MALYQATGKIVLVELSAQGVSQKGNEWHRVTLVIESPGFQNSINRQAFTAIGDWADNLLQNYTQGMEIDVFFSVSSREYQGKWYTDVQVARVNLVAARQTIPVTSGKVQAAPAPAPSRRSPIYDRVAATAPGQQVADDDPDNDLPF